VLYHSLEVVRLAAGMFLPIMPERTAELLRRIGLKGSFNFDEFFQWGVLQSGTTIEHGAPLFPRLEEPDSKQPVKEHVPDQTAVIDEGLVTYDEFRRTELKTAKVISAAPLEGTDRLLVLQVEIGEDSPRQLVAGIAEHYTPEELIGQMILVVSNLKPASIRGIESHGMLLAAKQGDKLMLVTLDRDVSPGAKVS
jgi:methionyl-tRNA synthetase